jgi:hypothetical protein
MISPDYTDIRLIPADHQASAAGAGWENAVQMVHPTTQDKRWIPAGKTNAAQQAGYVNPEVPAASTPSKPFQGLGAAAKENVLGLVTPQNAVQAYHTITEDIPAVYKAYEAARSTGASISDAYKAAQSKAQEINDAKNSLKNAVKDFTDNPNKAAWNAVLQLGTVALGGEALSAPEAVPEAAAETATAEAVAPEAAEAAKTSPVETAVTKGATKSKLPVGQPATVAPAGEDIQPTLQQGIRDTVNKVAEDNGLKPVQSKSIRDVGKGLGDQFYARSKNTFQQVQDATGVNPTDISNKISTLSDKIEAAVDDPEKAGALEQQKLALENQAAKAFEDAKAKGIDVEQARDDWKKYNAAYEFGQHVRNSAEGTLANPVINPSKLAPRLQKLSESTSPTQPGRLQQITGDEHASSLVEHAENARTATQAVKEFVPSSPTGQQALQDLLRTNTTGKSSIIRGGKVVGKTDWNGAIKDFENLTPEEKTARFGNDVPKVRQYLGRQALKQNAMSILLGDTATGRLVRLVGGEEILRRVF